LSSKFFGSSLNNFSPIWLKRLGANYSGKATACQVKNLQEAEADAKIALDSVRPFRYKEWVGREKEMKIISALKKLFLTSSFDLSISNHQETEGNVDMTKEVIKNYSEAQEAEMLAAGIIDNDAAIEFAAKFGKDVRSIRAKAVRMGIYKAKEKVSKTGGKIESKEAIVADIAAIVGRNLDGLEKASKQSLIAIRAKLAA
jgi:hypothetical protein